MTVTLVVPPAGRSKTLGDSDTHEAAEFACDPAVAGPKPFSTGARSPMAPDTWAGAEDRFVTVTVSVVVFPAWIVRVATAGDATIDTTEVAAVATGTRPAKTSRAHPAANGKPIRFINLLKRKAAARTAFRGKLVLRFYFFDAFLPLITASRSRAESTRYSSPSTFTSVPPYFE